MLKNKINIILIILSVTFALLFFRNQLNNLFIRDFNGSGYYYSQQFDLPERWINTDNLVEIGATSIENPSGLIYKFPKLKNDRVTLKFLLGKCYEEINEKYKNLRYAEITGTGKKMIFDYSNLHIGDTTIDLTNWLSGKENFNIHLRNSPGKHDKYKELVIRRIEVSVLPEANKFLPYPSLIIASIIIPFILFCFFEVMGFALVLRYICSFISLLTFFGLIHFYYGFMSHKHLYFVFAVFLLYFLAVKTKKTQKNYIYTFFLIFLLMVAMYIRWSEIERVAFAIANPDASHPSDGMGYRELADNMKLFTQQGFLASKKHQPHEPLYPFIAKFFFFIFGSSDLHLRFVSFFFSILAILLTYLVGNEIFGNKNIALLSAALISVNSFLIEQSSFGLRLELEMCFLLIFFYFCYLKREVLKKWVWVIASGGIGGLWLLTRSHNITVILFLFIYSVFSRKNFKFSEKMACFITMSLISISFLLPYKISMHKTQGDFFDDANFYITSIANREFEGKPTFPRSKVTFTDYYFKLRTPLEFVSYHIVGTIGIFYCLSAQSLNVICEQNHLIKVFFKGKLKGLLALPFLTVKIALLLTLTIFSLFLCLFSKNLRLVVYVIIMGVLPSIFFYGINIVKGMTVMQPYRTIGHVMPFIIFCISYAVIQILVILRKILIRKVRRV